MYARQRDCLVCYRSFCILWKRRQYWVSRSRGKGSDDLVQLTIMSRTWAFIMPTILLIESSLSSQGAWWRSWKYVPQIFLRKVQPMNSCSMGCEGSEEQFSSTHYFLIFNSVAIFEQPALPKFLILKKLTAIRRLPNPSAPSTPPKTTFPRPFLKPSPPFCLLYQIKDSSLLSLCLYRYIQTRKEVRRDMNKQSYRDITLNYNSITMDCQVACSEIVGHYFGNVFRQEHQDFFISRGVELGIKVTPFQKMKGYDVRLNSHQVQSSVKEAKLDFGAYNPNKRLTFYIIEETQPIKPQKQQQGKDESIQFQLLSGGTIEKILSLNIKDKTFAEVDTMIRQGFGVETSQMIQFLQVGVNNLISIDRSQQPFRRFRSLGLRKVGVKRVYTAG